MTPVTCAAGELSSILSIMDLAEALDRTRGLIKEKTRQVEELEAELQELKKEAFALEQAAERWGIATAGVSFSERLEWARLGRAEAVQRVLELANGGPWTNAQILRQLRETGREGDTANYTAAALSYLKRKGTVVRASPGAWALAKKAPSSQDSGEIEVSSTTQPEWQRGETAEGAGY